MIQKIKILRPLLIRVARLWLKLVEVTVTLLIGLLIAIFVDKRKVEKFTNDLWKHINWINF